VISRDAPPAEQYGEGAAARAGGDPLRTLAVVTNIPTPYRVPLFNTLAEALPEAGWRLHVIFGSLGNQRRRWSIEKGDYRFEHEFLEGRNLRLGRERIVNTYRGLAAALERIRPDGIVVTGYSAGTVAATRYARRAEVPLAIWSGTVAGPRDRAWWRLLLRRWLVRRSDGFLVYGSAARDYVLSLGATPDKVHIAWNTVDTDRFLALPAARGPLPKEPLRLLTVGYLEPGKRIDLALRAVAEAARRGIDVEIEVIGDGSALAELERLARDLGIKARFPGYVEYAALPARYATAHAFVFPTEYDIWGLVLVEAMAAGRPCVASVRAGATRDLVADGVTGYAVDFERTGDVADRIAALREPGTVERLGEAARERVRSGFTLAHSGAGWRELVEAW
jgi:glycosyltransferase involved in cell wall biosynthesis